jgi:hypothetical protein
MHKAVVFKVRSAHRMVRGTWALWCVLVIASKADGIESIDFDIRNY